MSSLGVVASGAAADAIATKVADLVEAQFASKLFAQDATLWGPDAESESAIRLSWVNLPRSSRPLVGEIAALREQLRGEGVDRVVLCGMGGSSLAPEVICATAGVDLVVLDSSQPDMVRAAITDLERTVVVVSSKSGSTVETDSQRRAFQAAFARPGIDPTGRIVDRHRPGQPARRGVARRWLPGHQRRPQRRWPLLGADRLRAGALGAGRGRHRGAARRRRGRGRRAQRRRRRQPRSAPRLRRWPAPTRCATSSSSSTTAPASSGSPTGPSS